MREYQDIIRVIQTRQINKCTRISNQKILLNTDQMALKHLLTFNKLVDIISDNENFDAAEHALENYYSIVQSRV